MLSDKKTYKDVLQKLLETRLSSIKDIVAASINRTQAELQDQRIAHQLREIVQLIKRTLLHIYQIFISNNSKNLLETYISELQKNFMMPAHSHHGHQPAITRVFLPSTNVHLLVRYLPESVQHYTPHINSGERLTQNEVRDLVTTWIEEICELMNNNLGSMMRNIRTQRQLTEIRSRIWDLLDTYENNNLLWTKVAHGNCKLSKHY